MRKLLGVFCPFWSLEGPHFVLPHFQGIFTSLGHEIRLLDLNLHLSQQLATRWLEVVSNEDDVWSDEPRVMDLLRAGGCGAMLQKTIADFNPDWVVFLSVSVANFGSVRVLVKYLVQFRSSQRQRFRIAAGGPLFFHTARRKEMLPGADLVVGGPLEAAVTELTQPEGQAWLRGRHEVARCAPDFRQIDFATYANPERLPYLLNYGCRFRCRFCHEGAQYHREISRPVAGLADELKRILSELPTVKHVRFNDGSINSNHPQMLVLLSELDQRGILWGCNVSPSVKIDAIIAARMFAAGCRFVNIGVESGSNRVRRLMGKPATIETVETVIQLLHDAGIAVSINLMAGYPGEYEEDVEETLAFLTRTRCSVDEVMTGTAAVFHGTPLYRQHAELGLDLGCSQGPKFVFNRWCTRDLKNTPEVRSIRRRRIEAHVAELGISVAPDRNAKT